MLGRQSGGILADRCGSGPVRFTRTVAPGAAVVPVVASHSVGWVFATTGLVEPCCAGAGPARGPLLCAVFPDRCGTAIAIMQAAGTLGNTLLPRGAAVSQACPPWQLGLGFVAEGLLGLATVSEFTVTFAIVLPLKAA